MSFLFSEVYTLVCQGASIAAALYVHVDYGKGLIPRAGAGRNGSVVLNRVWNLTNQVLLEFWAEILYQIARC